MDAFEVSGRHAHDPKNSDPYGDDLRIGPAEVPKKGLNFPKNARNHLNTPPIHPKYAQNTRRHRKKTQEMVIFWDKTRNRAKYTRFS